MLLLAKLLQMGTSKYGALVLVGFLAFQGYLLIRPSTPELDPARAKAADAVTAEAADALGEYAQEAWSGRYVKVARLVGDPDDQIRSRLEATLRARTNCVMVTDSLLAEVRNEAAAKSARLGLVDAATADAWKTRPIDAPEAALELARKSGLDYAVYGVVEDFRVVRGASSVRVRVGVADVAAGAVVFEDVFADNGGIIFADATSDGSGAHAGLRIVSWCLFALLLPICSASFWRGLLDRESNLLNVLCLVVLTVIDTLLAWALMGFWLGTFWAYVVVALVFGAAGTYNLFILSTLESARERRKYEV